jgi:hypothetical protein
MPLRSEDLPVLFLMQRFLEQHHHDLSSDFGTANGMSEVLGKDARKMVERKNGELEINPSHSRGSTCLHFTHYMPFLPCTRPPIDRVGYILEACICCRLVVKVLLDTNVRDVRGPHYSPASSSRRAIRLG